MRRGALVRLSIAAAAASFAACTRSTEPPINFGAIITVAFAGYPADTMHIFVTRSATIEAAQAYVATQRGPKLIAGTIVRGAGLDERYPFQFLAPTVDIIDAAVEACDGPPMHTDTAVNDFFEHSLGSRNAPTALWCPWSSYPVAVTVLGPD